MSYILPEKEREKTSLQKNNSMVGNHPALCILYVDSVSQQSLHPWSVLTASCSRSKRNGSYVALFSPKIHRICSYCFR